MFHSDEVAELFEPLIEAAVSSIRNQVTLSGGIVKSAWLVGGFASSPWLFSQLQERLTPDGIVVSRPDGQTSKVVADGAIGFYCDHHVGARKYCTELTSLSTLSVFEIEIWCYCGPGEQPKWILRGQGMSSCINAVFSLSTHATVA